MFDLQTRIMICIGSSLLIATIVLICIVICLYFKVSSELKAAKKPDAVAVNNNRSEVMRDKVSLAKVTQCKAIPTESCRALQCCDQCRLYGNCDSLPSCCCDVNEGL
ncbi:protein FAM24A-like isoform X2 [Cynocephalus volans]|uniref:protein FAM24A-like isoform X2 n=1 Tax=Cynocephalus volans TaxID=110931 RepID=UPI002FC70212